MKATSGQLHSQFEGKSCLAEMCPIFVRFWLFHLQINVSQSVIFSAFKGMFDLSIFCQIIAWMVISAPNHPGKHLDPPIPSILTEIALSILN